MGRIMDMSSLDSSLLQEYPLSSKIIYSHYLDYSNEVFYIEQDYLKELGLLWEIEQITIERLRWDYLVRDR